MRILVHDYAGHPFPVSLSRELARNGHAVTHACASNLLTPRGRLDAPADENPRLRFVQVPMSVNYVRDKYSFLKRVRWEWAYGYALSELIRQERPDVVLSGQAPSEPQLRMMRTAEALEIPVVIWVQDFYSIAVQKLARKKLPLIGAVAGAWYRHLDRQCFRLARGVVAITEDFVSILQEFGVPPEKVTVIPNWASLEDLPLESRNNPWALGRGLQDKFVFLYSGTLAMKHNPGLLWQLAERFRNERDVTVLVISEGPGADYLKQRLASESLSNLQVIPFQAFDVMPRVLASADVFVAVLEPEAGVFSVPSKVLTYFAAGRPVLAAIPQENLAARLVAGIGAGICVDPHAPDAFLSAASALHRDPETRTAMSARSRAYAEREFDLERITRRFEEVFQRALRTPGKLVSV